MQTYTPPVCWLRAGTIPRQLSQAKPAPPWPTPPAGSIFQLGGAARLIIDMLWLVQAHHRPLLFTVRAVGAAAIASSSALVINARLATLFRAVATTLNWLPAS